MSVRTTPEEILTDLRDALGIRKPETEAGVTVYSRDKKLKGKTTGAAYRCRMEGCMGIRIVVKWQDGHKTHPCSKGMRRNKTHWRIL